MTDFLVRRIASPPRSLWARLGLGLAVGALAVGIRVGLTPWLGAGAPYVAFLLAVLVSSVFGGVAAAAASMAVVAVAVPTLLASHGEAFETRRRMLGAVVFLASSGFMTWLMALTRTALLRETAARDAERLLRLELHHRVKNVLAVVQSLAEQSFRGATDAEAARVEFAARLSALAEVHHVLVDTGWRAVEMAALAGRALAPFRPPEAGRIVAGGPDVAVAPEAAVALALCLHELATNAAKYGALSGP
ncbi:MAG: sensor histidine kinase, partial [Phenylobacterium sp.]|nr:sensor histidine kinase [Phenylobacterium sp.]